MHSFTHISIRPSTRYTFTRFLYVPPPHTLHSSIHTILSIYLSIHPLIHTISIHLCPSIHTTSSRPSNHVHTTTHTIYPSINVSMSLHTISISHPPHTYCLSIYTYYIQPFSPTHLLQPCYLLTENVEQNSILLKYKII